MSGSPPLGPGSSSDQAGEEETHDSSGGGPNIQASPDERPKYPPLIAESQRKASEFRELVGYAMDYMGEEPPEDVPSIREAVRLYHRGIIEFHNRLKDYADHFDEDAETWWTERTINIHTFLGLNFVQVRVSGGAIDVLEEIVDQDGIKPGTQIKLNELQGLRSLIFVRQIRSPVAIDAGTSRNPDRTETAMRPDWLDAEVLYSIHDGLQTCAANVGFVEPPADTSETRTEIDDDLLDRLEQWRNQNV